MTAYRHLAILVIATAPLAAQGRVAGRGGVVRPPRAQLMQQIDQAFMRRAMNVMALTPEQLPRFQRVVSSWAAKRAALEQEDRELHQSLNSQYRIGVAANPDSAARLVEALNTNHVAQAEAMRDEMRELCGFLTPVQCGQFQLLRDQLLQKMRELQQQRAAALPVEPMGGE